jgi:hypothetical protein
MRLAMGARRAAQRAAIVKPAISRAHTAALATAALLAGCVAVPTGPSTLALPGTNKGFDQFQFDEGSCRQYASDSIGGQTAARAQEDAGARSLLAGAAIGAMIGGAVSGGHGAAVGAGIGTGGVMTARGKDIRLERGQELLIRSATETRIQ